VVEETGKYSRNSLQNHNTLDAIEEFKFDAYWYVVTRKKSQNEFFGA
jgi:hypothetical protein